MQIHTLLRNAQFLTTVTGKIAKGTLKVFKSSGNPFEFWGLNDKKKLKIKLKKNKMKNKKNNNNKK